MHSKILSPTLCIMRKCTVEHASLHIEKQCTQIETAFQRHNINRSQYAVRAGFDESCIRDGLGFLEQVHIFTTLSTMLVTSPLLTELGEILSPFSSILFTESSSLPLPVYKIDGTIWPAPLPHDDRVTRVFPCR